MATLEEIRRQARIAGVLPDKDVTIVDKFALGPERLKVYYRGDDGRVDWRVLTRADEPRLTIISPSPSRPAAKGVSPRTYALAPYIDRGLIAPPLPLEAIYIDGKGVAHTLYACVEHDGGVAYNYAAHDSLRAAANAAVAYVHRSADLGPCPHIRDGWDFWRFRDETGALVYMRVLRDRYEAR